MDIDYSIITLLKGSEINFNPKDIIPTVPQYSQDDGKWRFYFLSGSVNEKNDGRLRRMNFCIYYAGDDNRDLNFKFFDLSGFTLDNCKITKSEMGCANEINEKSDIYNRCKALFKFKAGVKSTLSSFEYRAIIQGDLEKNKDTLPVVLSADKILRVASYKSDEELEAQKEVIRNFINDKLSCGETRRCILIIDTFDHVSAALLEPIGTGNDNNLIVKGIFLIQLVNIVKIKMVKLFQIHNW